MKSFDKLKESIKKADSLLCVGLDSDINKIPSCFKKDVNGLFDFNKCIIETTKDVAAAYKINFAFYEQYGTEGFDLLKKTFDLIPKNTFTIADAKRGDIGNTSAAYAKAVFEYFNADSITVNPYMGIDSIEPFLKDLNKFVFILALTSNPGSNDFQRIVADKKPVYQHVIEKAADKYSEENIGFVVGATHPGELAQIRKIIPNYTFLIPGIGAQGGNIKEVLKANNNGLAVINVSRAVLYPELKENNIDELAFAEAVRQKACMFYNDMKL